VIGCNRVLILVMLLAVVAVASCQKPAIPRPGTENQTVSTSREQEPTTESGYDIPGVHLGPKGLNPAYDQVFFSPFNGRLIYTGDLPYASPIKTTEVVLGNGANAPHVVYRNDIETPSGQTRYNIMDIWIPGKNMESENVTLRLVYAYPDIGIRYLLMISADYDGHYRTALKIDISSEATLSDYDIEILVFINGKYQGKIPFSLHIVK
jgi:hypothetical protein